MFSREELIQSPAYILDHFQNELFRKVQEYMEKEKLNQAQLAEKLGVSKGYMSKVLNGYSNPTLKQLIRISLLVGLIPIIEYKTIEKVIDEDKKFKEQNDAWITVNTSDSTEIRKIKKWKQDKIFRKY